MAQNGPFGRVNTTLRAGQSRESVKLITEMDSFSARCTDYSFWGFLAGFFVSLSVSCQYPFLPILIFFSNNYNLQHIETKSTCL